MKRNRRVVRVIAIVLAVLLVGSVVVSALFAALAEVQPPVEERGGTAGEAAAASSGSFPFSVFRVEGHSMEPTLHDGEGVLVGSLQALAPRGSVVLCHFPNRTMEFLGIIPVKTCFVKRLVGVPGDTVYRENGVTHVVYADENGAQVDEALDDRMALYFAGGSPDDYEPCTLGENEYFVVGDNRYNSHDSRDWRDSDDSNDVGPITVDMVIGRVQKVLWPLDSIRTVE